MTDFQGTPYVSMAPTWNKPGLKELRGTPLLYLEIGVFEGSGARWVLENVLTHPDSRYLGVDPFILEGEAGVPGSTEEVERRCQVNLAAFRGKAEVVKARAVNFLRSPEDMVSALVRLGLKDLPEDFGFDVVFIDGSHHALHVMADSIAAWEHLKIGGVMVWDDYGFKHPKYAAPATKIGIDGFVAALPSRSYRVVVPFNTWQPAIVKLSDSVADNDGATE